MTDERADRTALVVEDDPDLAAYIAECLRADGLRVDVALNGEEALSRVIQRSPEFLEPADQPEAAVADLEAEGYVDYIFGPAIGLDGLDAASSTSAKWEAPGVVNKKPARALMLRLGGPARVAEAVAELRDLSLSFDGVVRALCGRGHRVTALVGEVESPVRQDRGLRACAEEVEGFDDPAVIFHNVNRPEDLPPARDQEVP